MQKSRGMAKKSSTLFAHLNQLLTVHKRMLVRRVPVIEDEDGEEYNTDYAV